MLTLGVELTAAGIRDIILPGEMKDLMNPDELGHEGQVRSAILIWISKR